MNKARIQIKGTGAEVCIDELDSDFVATRKKWFKEVNPVWRALNSFGHVKGVVLGLRPRTILFNDGEEIMSYVSVGYQKDEYTFSLCYKGPSQEGKVGITAVEYSTGIIFDSGDFEYAVDKKPWHHKLKFEIVKVIGVDTDTEDEDLDLEIITAVYCNGVKLSNIAEPKPKKTPKLLKNIFHPDDDKNFGEDMSCPSWES